MSRLRLCAVSLLSLAVGMLLGSPLTFAQIIGADPAACRGELSVCTQHMSTYSFVSLTQGNVAETYSATRVMSAFGPTIMFDLIYNSYNADTNRASLDTGIGFGWTHTYNDFLFTQGGNDIFRWGRDGRVTKFTFSNGTYQAAPGYFETLTANNDGSFTITTKHQTKFRYQIIPGGHLVSRRSAINGPIYHLTSITDRNNNATTLTYSGGNLVSITDTYNRSLTLTYNGNNHLASVTDPVGRVTSFTYDGITGTQLTTITDPLGHTATYTYDALNNLTTKVDRDGRKFTISYSFDLPISEVDANNLPVYQLSNSTNWATDQNQLNQNALRVYIPSTTRETDGRGNVWQYAYDSNGFPLTITAPDGATTTYTYDPNTLEVATITDANGHTSSFQYDAEGNLIQSTDANGNTTKFTYESTFNQMTSMTDPNGRTTSYAYDGHGNRLSETDPLGHTASMTYDSHGNVLTATDKRGNTTTYVYDAFGNRTKATDALNEVMQSTYDAVGNMTSMTDPNGHTTTYKYDALNRLTLQTDALGGTIQTVYDAEGDKIKVTDQDGNATSSTYDVRRRLVTTTDALGKNTTQSYDNNNNRVSGTDRNGHTTSFAYDVQNRLISTTDALGDVSSSTYDGVGNKLSDTDANGHTTTYLNDALNRRTQKADALNEVTTFGYDLTGLPGCPECSGPTLGSSKITKQTDCNGKVIYWAYDGLDRLAVELHKQGPTDYVITPNDAVNRYTYDENSNRTSMTDPVGNTTTYSYDAVNRQDQMVNAAGDTWTTTYDPKGNVKTVTTPNLNVTTNTYDALDRLIQVDDEAGRVANYSYDPAGNRLTSKDGNGNGTTSTYDADYQVTAVMDALGSKTLYTYDAVGNLLTTTDRTGSLTTNVYDSINRRTSTTLALGNTIRYTYDPVGNQTHITDPNGNATSYTYDAVDRLITETYADGSRLSYGYDCSGHLANRTDQNGQITVYIYSDLYFLLQRRYQLDASDNFTYDLADRMLTCEKGGWVDTFQWDKRSFLTLTTQNGEPIQYAYSITDRERVVYYPENATSILEVSDARGRIGTVEDITNLEFNVVQYSYDAANNVLSRDSANGVTATIVDNANNWVTSLQHNLGSTPIADFAYGYDKLGNRLSEQKRADSSPAQLQSFAYNPIYETTSFRSATVFSGGPAAANKTQITQSQFTLDLVGNWNSKTTDGMRETRTHNSLNEVTSINGVPLTYDANGNLLEDAQYRHTYNQDNQLTQVTDKSPHPAVLLQISYDALGRRVQKIGSPLTRRYFYDGLRVVEEQDVLQNPTVTYVYGNSIDEIVMKRQIGSGAIYFYQQNALGSVSAVTNFVGTPIERYRYDAYGRPTVTDGNGVLIPPNTSGTPHSAIGNPWMFTGRYLDEETGLFDYRSRYLHTGLGRFLQSDLIGNWGDSGNLGNGYAYVGNNPSSHTDPLGQGPGDPPYPAPPQPDPLDTWCPKWQSCPVPIAFGSGSGDGGSIWMGHWGTQDTAAVGGGWTNNFGIDYRRNTDTILGVNDPIGDVGVGLGKKPQSPPPPPPDGPWTIGPKYIAAGGGGDATGAGIKLPCWLCPRCFPNCSGSSTGPTFPRETFEAAQQAPPSSSGCGRGPVASAPNLFTMTSPALVGEPGPYLGPPAPPELQNGGGPCHCATINVVCHRCMFCWRGPTGNCACFPCSRTAESDDLDILE